MITAPSNSRCALVVQTAAQPGRGTRVGNIQHQAVAVRGQTRVGADIDAGAGARCVIVGVVAVTTIHNAARRHVEAAALRGAVEADVAAFDGGGAVQDTDAAAQSVGRIGGDNARAAQRESTGALDASTLERPRTLDLHRIEGERAGVENGAVARGEQFQIAQFGFHAGGDLEDADAVARARAGVAAAEDDGVLGPAVDDRVRGEGQPLGQEDRDRGGGALAAVEGDLAAAGHRRLQGRLRATGGAAVCRRRRQPVRAGIESG